MLARAGGVLSSGIWLWNAGSLGDPSLVRQRTQSGIINVTGNGPIATGWPDWSER